MVSNYICRGHVLRIVIGITMLALLQAGGAWAMPVEQWNRTFGGIDGDIAHSVQQTSDSGYILAGSTSSYGAWLIKANWNGIEQWNRTFAGIGFNDACCVQQTSDGGYIVAGSATLIKTDENGIEQWNRTFTGIVFPTACCVQQTSDGGYILVGSTSMDGASNIDAKLLKTDGNGIEQWNRTFGGISLDSPQSVQQTYDGGYIMGGITSSYGAGNNDAWLIKTNENGIEQWNRTFGGISLDRAQSVQQTSDGGYILGGWTYIAGSTDAWLIKTNDNGIEQWNKTFGGIYLDAIWSIQQNSDSGYILAGRTSSYGAGNADVWLIKTDNNGIEQWNKTFGGLSNESAQSVQQTSDGGYILGGYTSSYGAGNNDAWLIKVSSEGSVHNINKGTNYSTIQAAIDNASQGDEIHVDSGTYYENVKVNKSVTLVGEGENVTTINASNPDDHVFNVTISNVNITGFKVMGANTDHRAGIYLYDSRNSNISGNIAINNDIGIYLVFSGNNTLWSNKNISNNRFGIVLSLSNDNLLSDNTVFDNTYGAYLSDSEHNILSNNNVNSNIIGIGLISSGNNSVYNNFFNNTFQNFEYEFNLANRWNNTKMVENNIIGGLYIGGNYWAYPNGTGFSQICTDTEKDGICDLPYVLDANNTDYLPLSDNTSSIQTLLKDNFESYTPGTWPNSGGWEPFWNVISDPTNNKVTNQYFREGINSLQIYGDHNGCNGAMTRRSITLPKQFYIEASMMASGDAFTSASCHSWAGDIHISLGDGFGETGEAVLLRFYKDSYFRAVEESLLPYGQYNIMNWYDIKMKVNLEAGTVDYWINNNYVGQKFSQNIIDRITSNSYLAVGSGGGRGWIDNIKIWNETITDITPPDSVTNLRNITYASTYINWTWTDPSNEDFAKVMVYLDGVYKNEVLKGEQYYNATVSPGTYTIGTRTVDTNGNINATMKTHTASSILPAIRYINGTVMDSITKDGLSGVKVSTIGGISSITDGSGNYSLAVTSGSYPITATYDIRYYTNNSVTVSTVGYAIVVKDIELVKKPTGNITGSVKQL